MPFNGTEGSAITLNEAASLTEAYRLQNPGQVQAIFMGKDLLNQILAPDTCMGIRVYYAINAEQGNTPTLVFVGADANENDMVTGVIADTGMQSPPFSGVPNPLNS